jgi:hypothetical protein
MSIAAFACYGDSRKMGYCVHCGGPDQSRDHVPSKVLLDEPYPENMLVSPSCLSCNQGFSLDEEYLACLIECVLIGDVDPAKIERKRIAEILTRNSRLAEMLKKSRVVKENGIVEWQVDTKRITSVLLKLARGHVAYELNEPQLHEPKFFAFKPLILMTESERRAFEDDGPRDLGNEPFWPEVGSRAMQRIMVVGNMLLDEGWLIVQDDRYRFLPLYGLGGIGARIVLREYLACEVIWDQ